MRQSQQQGRDVRYNAAQVTPLFTHADGDRREACLISLMRMNGLGPSPPAWGKRGTFFVGNHLIADKQTRAFQGRGGDCSFLLKVVFIDYGDDKY